MKTTKFLSIALLGVLGMAAATSCSDDDKKNEPTPTPTPVAGVTPKPNLVLTQGIPTMVGQYQLTVNADGLLTEVADLKDSKTITFEYVGSRAADQTYNAKMTVAPTRDRKKADVYYLTLNAQGYIASAIEVEYDGDRTAYAFTYNADGRLTTMTKNDTKVETSTLTYTDGDVTAVTDGTESDTFAYTFNGSAVQPNTAGIMLFDEVYDLDMGDLEIAYFGGMLGTAANNLPATRTERSGETEQFVWTVGDNGKPARLEIYDLGTNTQIDEVINFTW